jgi:hypothetical protein
VTRRKAGLISALTLGALVVSGGVAMASLDEEPEWNDVEASDTAELPGPDDSETGEEETDAKVCLRLDKEAQRAIAKAAAEVAGGTIRVPLNKIEVIPCKVKTPSAPDPAPPSAPDPAPPSVPDTTPSSAPDPTPPSAPDPTPPSVPDTTPSSAPDTTPSSTPTPIPELPNVPGPTVTSAPS